MTFIFRENNQMKTWEMDMENHLETWAAIVLEE